VVVPVLYSLVAGGGHPHPQPLHRSHPGGKFAHTYHCYMHVEVIIK